jgi:hypothetical protein
MSQSLGDKKEAAVYTSYGFLTPVLRPKIYPIIPV